MALVVISGLAAALFAVPAVHSAFIDARRPPGFGNGVRLQAIDPKAYAVNTALFSGFAFWPGSPVAETVVKFLILNAIWIPVHLGWLAAGVTLGRLDRAHRAQRAVNAAMAVSMPAVAALAALAPR